MVQNIQIRKAGISDIPRLIHLYSQFDGEDVLQENEAIEVWQRFEKYPNFHLYIAELDQKVIGTFELLIMDNLAHKGAPSGIVEDVVVDSEYRSMGIGKKLMEYAIEICKNYGCYKMSLSSSEHREKAHAFYENMGFKKYGFCFKIDL